MSPPPPWSSRLVARVGAALHALLIGVALRALMPFSPWWMDVAAYAAFAAAGWWGVRIAERHPGETPWQQVIRGTRWIVVASLALAGAGVSALLTARVERVGLLGFAVVLLSVMLALVAIGGVALGCAAGRIVTAAGDAPDALDQLAARGALSFGLTGAAAWVLGVGAASNVGLAAAAAALVAALVVWRRDSGRIAWIGRVRAGTAPPWRWRAAAGAAAPRWSSADDGPWTDAIAREAARTEAPFREAPAAPLEVWGASPALIDRLAARRRRVVLSLLAAVCALGFAASVYSANRAQALPDGTRSPSWVGSLGSPVVRMSGANSAACAELGDGSVRCWGMNDGRFPGYRHARPTPLALPTLRGLRGVSLSRRHACALRGDGRVVCWGYGGDGRLGASEENALTAPRAVEGVDDVAQVATGEDFSCALRRDGSVWCWGCAPLRARYDPGGCAVYLPERVAGAPPFVEVVAGALHVCGRTDEGAVWCWGAPDALRRDPRVEEQVRRSPLALVTEAPVRAIFAAPEGGLAIDAHGRAWRWGNVAGLGGEPRPTPTREPRLDGAVEVAQRWDGGCAVMRDGAVACWGDNRSGQRGVGHTRPVAGVTRVPGLTGMRGVVATEGGACAWRDDDVACWGAIGQAR
jgi:hypothetical protein